MRKNICLILAALLILGTALSAEACLRLHKKTAKTAAAEQAKPIKTNVEAIDFEILPTMNTVSNAKNQVWVGTFQLVWNDLTDELLKQPVEFVGYKSVMAENLNRKEFTADELLPASYYKKWGLVSPALRSEIEKGIKDKFNETSDILGGLDWTPAERKYLLYAMLKKDFQYVEKFTKLPDDTFEGSEGKVKYFGIDKDSEYAVRNSIDVLFYNNSNDFAVKLKSKEGDIIYLYRTEDDKTLDKYYEDVNTKTEQFTGKKYLAKKDEFKAPMLDFKSERTFKELCGKIIKNTDYMITQAIETIQFKMDEAGVKLKSEAAIMMMATSCGPSFEEPPRYFNFDKKYVIFLKDGDKKPYFGMKITDAKKLQK